MTKLGLLKEGKVPIDRRVPLTPEQCREVMEKFPGVEIYIQPSEIRGYKDDEYRKPGLTLKKDLSDCDILIGVKEVNIEDLIPGKKFVFFSHTAKEQPYNRKLLQTVLQKNIHLIDYEYLTDKNNVRVAAAFGRYAGIVGAYNGLIGYGKRHSLYELKRAHQCFDMKELLGEIKKVKLPANTKILITGKGRVSGGAVETLAPLNPKIVTPEDFLSKTYSEPVLCQIDADVYTKRKDGTPFDFQHFFANPQMYEGAFLPFTEVTDLYMACHFWDPNSPVFMTKEDMRAPDFKISVITDISCDIEKPIPSTMRPSTIDDPFYGYNPHTEQEDNAFDKNNITVMAVDNLPCELPRDASRDFGQDLISRVFPHLFGQDAEGIIERASIAKDGKLTEPFSYLADYIAGR